MIEYIKNGQYKGQSIDQVPQQIVEALEGKGCATDELKKAFIAGSKFGAERFGSTAGWLGAKLENPDFDEWIATVKTQDEPKTETVDCDCTEPEGFTHGTVCPKCNRPFRITKTVNASLDRKRLNEKMLKDLSAKELEDDVNRNKI